MKKPVTIYDIAEKLQLTASTVSRALNGSDEISDATRKRVLEAARKMKYRQNLGASNLRTGRKKTIGVVVPQINNQFFSNVISGIEEATSRKGFNLLICQSGESYDKEVESVRMLSFQNVASIVISLSKNTVNTDHVRDAIEHGIPVIQFDRTDKKLDSVKVLNNNIEAAVDAVKHLHDQGYRKIAYLSGPRQVNIFKERLQGFRQGMKDAGLVIDENFIANDCLTRERAEDIVKEWLSGKNPPDAVLAAADLAALGALSAAKSMQKQVPEDLGICGFSNEPYTELTSPTLSSVNQFSTNMGIKIGELVSEDEPLRKSARKAVYMVNTLLIPRESSLRK